MFANFRRLFYPLIDLFNHKGGNQILEEDLKLIYTLVQISISAFIMVQSASENGLFWLENGDFFIQDLPN